jgi:CDP-glucose 4,6-dehydratase
MAGLGQFGKKMINTKNLPNFYKGKKVLVTGHTGFKGAWLVEILTHWGAKVTGIALPPHTEPNLYTVLNLKKRIKNYICDIRDFEKIEEIFKKEKPEIVFHLAAQAIVKLSYEDPLRTISSNVLGTANILHAIDHTKSVKSAVIITSDKAYENVEWIHPYREIDRLGGRDPYSASKSAADIIAQSYIKSFLSHEDSPLVAIARAGNVIGGGDWSPNRIVPDIVRSVYHEKKPLITRMPNAIRPWQFVFEPLSGYLLLGKKLYEGDTSKVTEWNFGPNDGNFVTVETIIKHGIDIMKKGSYKVEPDPNMHEAGLLKLDISKARALLDWHPKFNLLETMENTFGWYKTYYEKGNKVIKYSEKQIEDFFKK